jgi:dTDP-4-amino-4,6-dideoxygalactose transaminase
LLLELEDKLTEYLALQHSKIIVMNNGTIPIQIALKLLANGGEVITTPFSYVATTAAIVWQNCIPVFVDIHPDYLTIDETKIEAAITNKTTCILATHVFGNPCNIEAIDAIATNYNLKVIYDAAHCFGVTYKGKSIFEFGDISTCSFHATKIFHTGEGGAIFCKDKNLYEQVFLSHAFGHLGDNHIQLGINGKMSELSAAMGLAVLPYMDKIIETRKHKSELYRKNLNDRFNTFSIRDNTIWNYSYYPILFDSESELILTKFKLEENKIFARRYFYPSLNNLEYLNTYCSCEISESVASRILCLPLYFELHDETILNICEFINLKK